MDSVDGARSIKAASDEILHQCDPCKYEGNEKTAVNFCQMCKEYLCNDCTDFHRKFTVSRNHKILSAEKAIGQLNIISTSCTILCESCKVVEVTDFCEQHHSVICQTCRSIKHRKCQCLQINEKVKSYDEAKLGQTTKKLKLLTTRLDQLLKDRFADLEKLKKSKEACIAEIKTLRQETNTYLDILEEKIINELEMKENQERNEIELHLSTVSATKETLTTELRLLEDAMKTSLTCSMFAADVKVSNCLKEYEKLLKDINEESRSPVITFKRNNQLDNMKSITNEFGTLAVGYLRNRRLGHNLFLDMSVQSSHQVDVKQIDDRAKQFITGCDVLPDAQIILCDYSNDKVKLLSRSFTFYETLELRSWPFDVSVINNNSAVITLPVSKQLQYIELKPSLKCGRIIQLDKMCFGVQVVGESVFITLHNDPGQGEVRILGLEGIPKESIGVNQDGSFMFSMPYYLTVSSRSGRIYTSDYERATVTCIGPDRSVVYEYRDNKRPTGLCVDAEENLIVCDKSSEQVHIITSSGKMSSILLTADYGVKRPYCVAHSQMDNTLFIGCINKHNLLVCHF